MKKRLILMSVSLSVLLALGATAYATSNQNVVMSEQEYIISSGDVQEGTKGSILFKVDENGKEVCSLDEGETWEEAILEDEVEYTVVTEADILKEIEEIKSNIADSNFMSDWHAMGKTEQDLLDYIKNLENQLEAVKNGAVFTVAGTGEILIDGDINYETQISSELCITFETEDGEVMTFIGETKEAVALEIEKAYQNNEITKIDYDEMLKQLNWKIKLPI